MSLDPPVLSAKLTEKAREYLRVYAELEEELAALWREPFETYAPAERLRWADRRIKCQRAFDAIQRQL
jgi:molybdenum-dependent DNA-binding transcriptional regulator ModE